jgi:BRCT domain type II-containing protein
MGTEPKGSPPPPVMTATTLTAEAADAALKPFGIRVTAWSSTKFLVWKGDQNECKRREKVAELIEAYQSYAA